MPATTQDPPSTDEQDVTATTSAFQAARRRFETWRSAAYMALFLTLSVTLMGYLPTSSANNETTTNGGRQQFDTFIRVLLGSALAAEGLTICLVHGLWTCYRRRRRKKTLDLEEAVQQLF